MTGQPDPELTLATTREMGNIIFSSPLPAAAASVLDQVRVPQYGHLKGLALYDAIIDLPDWQQMQEMTPWFGPLGIVLRYLSTHEGYTYLFDEKHKSGKDALERLTEMAFPVKPDKTRRRKLDPLRKAILRIPRQLELSLEFLQSHKPLVPFPPSNLEEEVTITIPGPVDCSYTVINQPFPEMKSDQNSGSKRREARGDCVLAIMEHFQDQESMLRHYTLAFLRLRAICPDLKPWGIGQSILDTNPGILENSFLFRECFQSFWDRNYESCTTTKTSQDTSILTWCREHQCLERHIISRSLHLQLSLGLFNYKEWVFLVSKMWDYTQRPGAHTDYKGSQGCQNGICRTDDTINISCISPCDSEVHVLGKTANSAWIETDVQVAHRVNNFRTHRAPSWTIFDFGEVVEESLADWFGGLVASTSNVGEDCARETIAYGRRILPHAFYTELALHVVKGCFTTHVEEIDTTDGCSVRSIVVIHAVVASMAPWMSVSGIPIKPMKT